MLITDEYRSLLSEMHKRGSFGSGSGKHKKKVQSFGLPDFLDYGCGKGKLDAPHKYDPAIKEFSAEPKPADLVVCTDVLEHIEPDLIENVLSHIKSLAKKKAFFIISCREARKLLPDGRNAHILLRPPEWWIEILSRYFSIEYFQVNEDSLEVVCNAVVPD